MAKSVAEVALAKLDAQIADLQRAKEMISWACMSETNAPEKPKRGRPKRKGMPEAVTQG